MKDEDFKSVVSEMETHLTGKVMAPATTEEDRNKALSQYHGLRALLGRLHSEAQNADKD
jgi:hypothetical protein